MRKIYLNPLPVRIWHWINAAAFIILIITGVQIRFSGQLGLMSFKTAVQVHSLTALVLVLNYLNWLVYHIFTGKLFKIYIPSFWKPLDFLKRTIKQAIYYGFGIMIGWENPHHPTPDNKFNPLQQLTYLTGMLLFLPLQIITGFMLWDPQLFRPLVNFFGGIQIAALIHTIMWMIFSAFVLGHIYLGTLGRTPIAHFKAMITGYEEEIEKH